MAPKRQSFLLDHGGTKRKRRRQPLASGGGGVESCREWRERRRGPLPLQLVHALDRSDVASKRRQLAKQKGMIALAKQRARQRARIHDVDVPETPVLRNRFEMDVAGEGGPRRPRGPTRAY